MPKRTLQLISFGHKHGPVEADHIVDIRHWPNPYWQSDLAALTGLDHPVISYLETNAQAQDALIKLTTDLQAILKNKQDIKSIAIGCTGGQHRSVYAVEKLAKILEADYSIQRIEHRENHRW